MTEEEAETALETDELFIVLPSIILAPQAKGASGSYPHAKKAGAQRYSSRTGKPLAKEEIRALLKKEKLL